MDNRMITHQDTSQTPNMGSHIVEVSNHDTPQTPDIAEIDYKSWNNNATKILIDLYKEYREKVGSLEYRNMKKMWERIASDMKQNFKVNVTPSHCENRWRVLERNYKKYVDNNNKTGRGRKFFEYALEMDAIFGKKRNVHPELLLSSSTVDHGDFEVPRTMAVKNICVSEGNNIQHPHLIASSTMINSNCGSSSNRPSITRPSINLTSNRKDRRKLTESLIDMKKDKMKYYREKLDLQKKKLELEEEKLKELKRHNDLIEERNNLLKKLEEKQTSRYGFFSPDMYK